MFKVLYSKLRWYTPPHCYWYHLFSYIPVSCFLIWYPCIFQTFPILHVCYVSIICIENVWWIVDIMTNSVQSWGAAIILKVHWFYFTRLWLLLVGTSLLIHMFGFRSVHIYVYIEFLSVHTNFYVGFLWWILLFLCLDVFSSNYILLSQYYFLWCSSRSSDVCFLALFD